MNAKDIDSNNNILIACKNSLLKYLGTISKDFSLR